MNIIYTNSYSLSTSFFSFPKFKHPEGIKTTEFFQILQVFYV